ncbi:hypothetical protein [Cupriavidus pampae]|uniref:Uncharacterized protein n=1 Tax=Cupriavidus pampae TaxID=659251 RepID=A0ABM8X8M2_9BURK|nr:hypothetical protein [Cupriavidus pampae]CAG9176365.1 hypothetical protein LMG32289_03508 [Cupriavidus pampae]
MGKLAAEGILTTAFPKEIVTHMLQAYDEVAHNYRLEKWKTSELDAGHFVESVRRLIEQQLFGQFTPFSTAMGSFNQGVLNKYEGAQSGGDEFRILIPRVLYAMYCIRNKRGVGHIGIISPNKLDASFILNSAKWVLAELVRLAGGNAPDEASRLVDQILERQVDLIWDDGESFMVLNSKLRAPQKVLLVLYKQDRLGIESLREKIQYSNKSAFKKIVQSLQRSKHIDITIDGLCKLSPLGVAEAEAIIEGH